MTVRRLAMMAVGALLLGACASGCGGEPDDAGVEPASPAAAPAPTPAGGPPPALGPELTALANLIGNQQTEAARDRLTPYLQQHAEDGRAEFLMGLSYHREKRYALARPHFERAVELTPDYHPAYHFLGWCLYYLGELTQARTAFEQHLAWMPNEGDSHFGLGLIDLDEDRLDAAELRFHRAIELQAGDPRGRKDVSKAHARLADVHIRRDEIEAARAELEIATELWPQHYTAFYKLSRVLNRLGETEAAQQAFRQYQYWERRAEQRRGVPETAP
ncbi:MAG: tetratricopeptide repeat protein [Planctomycetota bacterium]|jgi:tetratricopeptide (TPR) repeat protein